MSEYRYKESPVVTAWQWDGSVQHTPPAEMLGNRDDRDNYIRVEFKPTPDGSTVWIGLYANRGKAYLDPGDWFVLHGDGRIQDMADAEFRATFEPVDEAVDG